MRSLMMTLLLAAAAAPVLADAPQPAEWAAGARVAQTLGDETVCGLPSFPRRRLCFIEFSDWYAWIYFGSDGRTLDRLELTRNVGPMDRQGLRPEYRRFQTDAQGRLVKAVSQKRQAAEQPLSADQAAAELDAALAAFTQHGLSRKSDTYCSGLGEYEGHRLGCCDGLKPVRVSNDAYQCGEDDGPRIR